MIDLTGVEKILEKLEQELTVVVSAREVQVGVVDGTIGALTLTGARFFIIAHSGIKGSFSPVAGPASVLSPDVAAHLVPAERGVGGGFAFSFSVFARQEAGVARKLTDLIRKYTGVLEFRGVLPAVGDVCVRHEIRRVTKLNFNVSIITATLVDDHLNISKINFKYQLT